MEAATLLRTPTWYRALSLCERHTLLTTCEHATPLALVDEALAERRRQRWQSQPPFDSDLHMSVRLEADGISREQWHRILGESPACVQERCSEPPHWLDKIHRAFQSDLPRGLFPVPEAVEHAGMLGFLAVVQPLLDDAWERFRQASRALPHVGEAPFDPDTVANTLASHLPWQLTQMLSRTMILELNVARLRDELQGDTPEDRFDAFLDRLANGDVALNLLQEYPVLARQLITAIDSWVDVGIEFLGHLVADWEELQQSFFPGVDPGPLTEVKESGDNHRGGRSVLIASFANGARVVYKPKPLALDVHFQDLLCWMNQQGMTPAFRTLTILDRGNHGWVEFVESHGCETQTEIERFYQRQGGLLALLYTLEATDLHSENLIAAGEHPVFIDLETLFHPYPPGGQHSSDTTDTFLDRSVLRTGLLPERIWTEGGNSGIDVSGLGAELEQQTPFGVPRWDAAGTDAMRVVFKQVTISGAANRPLLQGKVVDVVDFADAVVDGFTRVYRLLGEHRDALRSPDGLIRRFGQDEVRVILRPTTTYCVLLRESFHPDFLRDGLDRDRLFDRLWAKVHELPYLAPVIRAESSDLWQGDIPVFTTRPNSRDLFTSGGECLANYFDTRAMARVERRFEELGEADLARQTWVIRGSLATIAPNRRRKRRSNHESPDKPSAPSPELDRERLIAAACKVGARLEQLALRDSSGVTWVGLSALDERHCTLELLGPDLYDGLPGVMLFLAYLSEITREQRWADLARATLSTLRRQIAGPHSRVDSIGAFSGWGGVIYSLVHLGQLWDQPTFIDEAHAAAMHVRPGIEQDHHFDIVTGAAGCLGGLARLYSSAPSSEILELARACGDHLLTHAQVQDGGLGWPSPLPARGPLTGFSHGASGIGWALLELTAMTGEDRYEKAAQVAVRYERGQFSPSVGNWLDLREAEESGEPVQECVTAWCHGAPGIGLARIHYLQFHDDPAVRAEAEAAVKTTIAHGVGWNHSLCHGDLGNLELVLQASERLNASYRNDLARLAGQVVADIERHGWICGVPNGIESPGLMTGLAGIGYGLLRLAEPTRVPSLLSLERPRECDHAR